MIRNINYHIIPECCLDTNLVETIVPPQKYKGTIGYNHRLGCNDVVKLITKELSNNFAVGIVDWDKRKLDHTEEFQPIVTKLDINLYAHPNKNHYLIFHKPIEKWIFEEVSNFGISLANYDLPTTLREFTKISKRKSSKTDIRFTNLFKELVKEPSSSFFLLAQWIQYLKNHPYDADRKILQNL